MGTMHERLAALERAVEELASRQGKSERRQRLWRGLAGGLALVGLSLLPLRSGRAANAYQARIVALQRLVGYQANEIVSLQRLVAYRGNRLVAVQRVNAQQAQQIAQWNQAYNQAAARRPAASGSRAPASGFTPAQTATLQKLAALIEVSAGVIRCKGDLALLSKHVLLTNKIGPLDAAGQPDDTGVLRCSGDLSLPAGHTLLVAKIAPADKEGQPDTHGVVQCKGDLALTPDHTLLADKIAPVDSEGRPDDDGTTSFSGSVSVAKKLSQAPAPAKASP